MILHSTARRALPFGGKRITMKAIRRWRVIGRLSIKGLCLMVSALFPPDHSAAPEGSSVSATSAWLRNRPDDETTQELAPDQLVQIIQTGELHELGPGELLFQEGDPSDSVYLLLSGTLEFTQRDSDGEAVPWLSSGHGDFVGEMGLLENRPRSATGRARDQVRVLRFTHDTFMDLVTHSPALVWSLMRTFSARLRQRERGYTLSLQARNRELAEAAARLQELNSHLEQLVAARTQELATANSRLAALATTDEVTGLYNRRYLQETLDHKAAAIQRAAHPFAIIMVDIDHFKHYNDRNGHLAGDGVLRKVADLLRGVIRGGDVIARYGGEEFCIVLENALLADGERVADKLRRAVCDHAFPKGIHQPLEAITISLGVAAFPETADAVPAVLAAADSALYAAKNSGRNRVALAPVRRPAPVDPAE